jgi:hypothetical protein
VKKRFIIALGVAMLFMAFVSQAALAAGPPGPGGSKNCIGYCVSQGLNGTMAVNDFARLHNSPAVDGCGMFRKLGIGSIRDANPPQP